MFFHLKFEEIGKRGDLGRVRLHFVLVPIYDGYVVLGYCLHPIATVQWTRQSDGYFFIKKIDIRNNHIEKHFGRSFSLIRLDFWNKKLQDKKRLTKK